MIIIVRDDISTPGSLAANVVNPKNAMEGTERYAYNTPL
jgi:hypothetical protein